MADKNRPFDQQADDGLAVAPPPPPESENPMPKVRTAHDASDDARLAAHPANPDAKLDVGLDETFPSSDPPANTRPGAGNDPAPSSGYDEESEARMKAGE